MSKSCERIAERRSCLIFPSLASELSAIDHDQLSHFARNGGARRDRTDDLMLAKHALSQLSYGPVVVVAELRSVKMVGLGRLELPTSRLSSARSNQLSYKPDEASSSGPRTCAHEPRRKKEGKRRRRQGADCLMKMLGLLVRDPKHLSLERR